MLSSLSRGYSSWTGELDPFGQVEEKTTLPEVGPHEDHTHKHGVTVSPRSPSRHQSYPPLSALSFPPPPTAPPLYAHAQGVQIRDDGCLDLPKTYLTRKGALLLFAAPEALPGKDCVHPRLKQPRKRKQELIDLSLKLGTLERLSMSVLQYGDQGFDRETTSITDKENRWFLKFLHGVEPPEPLIQNPDREGEMLIDSHAQPGADLKFYLQDLKQRASSRGYGRESSLSSRARSQELRDILQQLEDAWPSGHSQPLSQVPTSFLSDGSGLEEEFFYPRSPSLSSESSRAFSGRARVLSSKKLTASLKSLNYLGRPQSTESVERAQSDVVSRDLVDLPHGSELTHTRRTQSAYWTGTPDTAADVHLKKLPPTNLPHAPRELRQRATIPDVQMPAQDQTIHDAITEESTTVGGGLSDRPQSRDFSIEVSSGLRTEETGKQALQGTVEDDRGSVVDCVQEADDDAAMTYGDELAEEGQGDAWPVDTEEDAVLTKPLQPLYSGVLQDEGFEMLPQNGENALDKSDQGSRSGSQAGSVASVQVSEVYRPTTSRMSSRAASRAGMLPGEEEEEEVDQQGLDELMAEGSTEDNEELVLLEQVSEQLAKQEKYTASNTGSEDKQDQDPETLVPRQQDDSVAPGPQSVESLSSVQFAGGEEPAVDNTSSKGGEGSRRVSAANSIIPELVVTSSEPPAAPSEMGSSSVGAVPEISVRVEVREPTAGQDGDDRSVKSDKDALSAPDMSQHRPPSVVESEQPRDRALSVQYEDNNRDEVCSNITSSSADPDYMTLAMVEAGYKVIHPTSLRPVSPAPSSAVSVALPLPGLDRASMASVGQPPAKMQAATPRVTKPEAKTTAVKANVPVPHPPTIGKAKTAATPPRNASPGKGGKTDKKGGKSFVKAMDITSVQPDGQTEEEAAKAQKPKAGKKMKEAYRPPPPPPRLKVAEKKELLIPEHMKDAIMRNEAEAQRELENELMKMHKAMNDSLGMNMLITEDSEGLTEEELFQAEQALRERIEEAHRRMQEAVTPGVEKSKASPATSPRKPDGKGKVKKGKKVKAVDPKAEEAAARKEASRQQRELEKQKRLQDAQKLQDMIKAKQGERKSMEAQTAVKVAELEEQMEMMRQEEESIAMAEEDARLQMAALRKIQREERDARRKTDLEKKKQDALARRDKEKAMMEAARLKEQEMLERIADAEMRRSIREEEERKRDEEERLAQERYEEELQEAQRLAEEEEARLQELERQAEEEAFQRIVREREEAERQRIELEYQARKMAEEEEMHRQLILEEEKRLEEERKRHEADEYKRVEEERARLKELQRMDNEAREKMRAEIEQRRELALKRREVNVDRRRNFDGLCQSQGVSHPWTFTYFIHWPRENYSRPMGQPIEELKKGKGKGKPKAK